MRIPPNLVTEAHQAVAAARQAAESAGGIPRGYPLHVTLVMKILAALLPWYTRSIRHALLQCAIAAERQQEVLKEFARAQDQFGQSVAGYLRTLEVQAPPALPDLNGVPRQRTI